VSILSILGSVEGRTGGQIELTTLCSRPQLVSVYYPVYVLQNVRGWACEISQNSGCFCGTCPSLVIWQHFQARPFWSCWHVLCTSRGQLNIVHSF